MLIDLLLSLIALSLLIALLSIAVDMLFVLLLFYCYRRLLLLEGGLFLEGGSVVPCITLCRTPAQYQMVLPDRSLGM